MQYFADLYYHDGSIETIKIAEENIDDIVDAVEGQFTFINNKTGFAIKGENIAHVDIWSK